MASLDTNILLRYLVKDDPAQARVAAALIDRSLDAGEVLYIPVTVLLELEWVLRSRFAFDKSTVVQTLTRLLTAIELSFASERAVEWALRQYQNTTADFSDCIHVALAQDAYERPWWTFDRAASRLDGARLLTASS